MSAPETIRPRDLQERLQQGEAIQLVDVREAQELELARLNHPVLHLPLSQSSLWMETITDTLDREQPVAVICHAGVRSWHFGSWLIEQHGFPNVWNVQGGIDAWSNDVDPGVPQY